MVLCWPKSFTNAFKSEVLNLCPETSLILAWWSCIFSKPKVNVLKLFTEMNSIVLSYWILLVKQGMKNSDTTSSLSDLYSCFKDKSRNVNKIKTSMNYLRKFHQQTHLLRKIRVEFLPDQCLEEARLTNKLLAQSPSGHNFIFNFLKV